jgi:hypothetical protein
VRPYPDFDFLRASAPPRDAWGFGFLWHDALILIAGCTLNCAGKAIWMPFFNILFFKVFFGPQVPFDQIIGHSCTANCAHISQVPLAVGIQVGRGVLQK